MADAVRSFIDKGTGPRLMQSVLRANSRRLGALLQAIGAVDCMRAKVPLSLWGGDIFGVMSKQLRSWLEGAEPPRPEAYSVPAGRSLFGEAKGPVDSKQSRFSSSSSVEKAKAKGFAPPVSANDSRSPFLSPDDSRAEARDPFSALSPENAAFRSQWPEAFENVTSRSSFSETSETKERKPNGKPVESLLDKKLRQYWEASESKQVSERDSVRNKDAEANIQTTAAPFSAERFKPPGQSWPEITARQAAQKLRSPGSNQISSDYSARAQQTINSGSPDKVEIQNVFNIEVKTERGGGAGSTEELSEKIADILREQAIRHGIDVT
ncbi:MAG: hypothetical protein L0229_09430 [Blastocatellia bacterium]|nr:hypothetical protein [Blastocatellia bacterium]